MHKGNNVSDLAKAIEELIDGSWETDLDISLITENSSENKKHIKEVKETFESYLDIWIDDIKFNTIDSDNAIFNPSTFELSTKITLEDQKKIDPELFQQAMKRALSYDSDLNCVRP